LPDRLTVKCLWADDSYRIAIEKRQEDMQAPGSGETFYSTLFDRPEDRPVVEPNEAPDFFGDLNLDQIVDAITAGRDEYNLKPFFYSPLTNVAGIEYRHEVIRDLENGALFQSVKSFSSQMRDMRQHLVASEASHYKFQKERWFLDAVEVYCAATDGLLQDLSRLSPTSHGLRGFALFLEQYTGSESFTALRLEAKKLTTGLAAIRYNLLIKDGSVTVSAYDGGSDYSADVEATFAKFKQGTPRDYLSSYRPTSGMNHVEAAVLEFVARLNPNVFLPLLAFCESHKGFAEKTIVAFDREIQLYIAWLEYAETFKGAGLRFCYPHVSDVSKSVGNREGFDLALAGKLIRESKPVICNDFMLAGQERVFVVTGPNQGGKTTFARTFGQLHYLASLGLPVPGREAQLFLCDRMFTHFERVEDIATLRGKLQDDLVRIHHILGRATPKSVIVMNEVFSSTTLKDAVHLSKKVMAHISQRDALCVWVTFLDELASFDVKTVSMVAAVERENLTERTYKIERRPADGLSYALAIAGKYGLNRERIKERMKL